MSTFVIPPPTNNLRTIFVDSNIETHLAMVVSLFDTITDVKAKIAAEHALCFQHIGEISVEAIKVKRRGFFYNLADSMYVLNAFDRIKGSWFVCIEVTPMCTFKDQKVLPNKVTHEQLKHHDYIVPPCSVDKHQEIVFCGLLSKNSGLDGQEIHNPSIDLEHKITMLIDQEKYDRTKDECKNLCNEATDAMPSASCSLQRVSSKRSKTSQHEKLLENQSQQHLVEKINGCENQKDAFHEENLDTCRIQSKFSGSEDIDESNKSVNVPQEINFDGKKEILATSSEGLLSKLPHENIKSLQNSPVKKHSKKRKSKSSKSRKDAHLAMPSVPAVVTSPQVTTDSQNSGKEANGHILSGKFPSEPNIEEPLPNIERDRAMHDTASFLEATNQKETTTPSVEANKESFDRSEHNVNSSQYTNLFASLKQPEEAKVPVEVVSEFSSKLRVENAISLQNPADEKNTKKRKRKSSKSHEVAHLGLPNGTAVFRSSQLTADSHNSGEKTDTSFFSGKNPTELSIGESLANDKKHISTSHDAESFLEVINKKESKHSLEMNKEPIEEHNIQFSSKDQTDKHLNIDFSPKEHSVAGVSSKVAYESPTKSNCGTVRSKSQSRKILKPKDTIDQENKGSETTNCVRDMNFVEVGYVGAATSASAENFPNQRQATDSLSILEGANKNCNFTKVNSKSQSKSQRSRKRSKAESSEVCDSTDPKENKDHFNSDNAQVFLTDTQNESNAQKFIKQAGHKANGGHSVDTVIKISSSSKKVSKLDKISIMSSANPPISIPNHISEASHAYVEQQAAETGAPAQVFFEVQEKPRRSQRRLKIETSKLGSQENFDSVLLESNREVTESNDKKGSYQSKLANESNQKKELHCMDATVKAHLSDDNSSKLVNVGQVDPSESSNYFSERSNAEILIKGHVIQHEALTGPTKSKGDRKKSKKETLKAQLSSEVNEPMGLSRPDESTIKFDDYFIPKEGKHSQAVHAADPPSQKSESRKKKKTGRKTDESQPCRDPPTNFVQPSSHKQHMPIGQPLENETIKDSGNGILDAETKDSEIETVLKSCNTKESTKQNSPFGRIESDLSLYRDNDDHKLHKKLQNDEPESHVQLSKLGAMENQKVKKITANGKKRARPNAPGHDIDNVVAKDTIRQDGYNSLSTSNPVDPIGSNNFEVSQCETTEDIPNEKKRDRVVTKTSSRKSKMVTNNSNHEKSLLVSSGGIFSDALVTSSESESDTYKKKGAIKTTVVDDDSSISGDSESQFEETQTKANALKLQMDTNSGVESDEGSEISKETDGGSKNHDHIRSDDALSTKKMPLSFLLKSSMSYRKTKLTASQNLEFDGHENQPIDVVLETQPESAVQSP